MPEQENKENISKPENGESSESIEAKDTAGQPAPPNKGKDMIEKKAKKEEKKKKMYRRITVILLIVIVILILLLLQRCSSDVPVLNPDFPPQETEQNAQPIPGGSDEKLEHEEGGGSVRLTYSDKVTIDLTDKKAKLHYLNPSSSTQDIMIRIIIKDQVIAQSGLLLPGYQVRELDLIADAEKMLIEGTYSGKFEIYFYDPETNERAMLNAEAPITITVQQ